MFATQYVRTVFKLLILATLLVAAPACRTGTTAEAGVDQRLFEKPGTSLGYNPRGYWFAVGPQNATLTDYVTIEHDGQTELFYAVAQGERAAQLLPLTPVESNWFANAVEAGVEPTFVDDLEQARLSDPIGLWSGETSEAVRWLGAAPSEDVAAVALPATAPKSIAPFFRWTRGVVNIGGGQATPVDGDFGDGPFLLLPEKAPATQTLRVVNLSKSAIAAPEDAQISVKTRQRTAFDAGSLYEYALLPVGRELGADLLFFDADGAQFVFHVGPEHARIGAGQARLVAAAAEGPLLLRNPEAATRVMRGFQALREGRTLAASHWLSPDDLGLAQNQQAGALRLAELPAAAGLSQWSRVALLQPADGMSADRVLYLARAHALEGDLAQAIMYASDAATSFRSWPSPARYTGAARTKLLRTQLEHVQSSDRSSAAIEYARDAVKAFESAGDALRQADAEMALAEYLFAVGSPDNAIKYANLARSRYYHAGSPYFSALAEIALAEFMLDSGQTDETIEMAGYARARMKKFGEPVGLSRARLVEALAQRTAGQKRDISGELENVLARAREHKDLRTQALAASALVTRAGVDETPRIVELGAVLLETRDDIVDPFAERELQRALAALCGQGFARLAASDARPASNVEQACAVALEKVAGDPATLSAWLDQGYKALQQGNMMLAGSTADQLADSLDEQLETSSPVLAARIHFFRHAVQTVPGLPQTEPEASATEKALLEQAFSLLTTGVDPASAPTKLFELAREHRARGLTEVAGHLGQQAMKAARDQKDYERERELLFFLLDTYQRADMPSKVLELAIDGRKIVSRAGPGSDPLEARVLTYQSDAEYRLGRTSDGALHRSNALATAKNADDATHLGLLLLAARLDMERRAIAAAEPLITRALGMYDALGPKTRTEPRFVTHLTRLHTLHGELGVRLGKLEAAQKAFDTALRLSTNGSSESGELPELLAVRADALVGRAGLADEQAATAYHDKLASLLDRIGDFGGPKSTVDQHTIDAHRVSVEYFTDAGDASQALDVAEKVHDAGFSLAPRKAAPCVIGRPRLFAGKDKMATQNLKACAANNSGEVRGEFATLLLALTDKTLDAPARAKIAASVQETLDDKLTAAERDRLVFIQTLANPQNSFDERRATRLEKSASANQSPADVDAYASYLLSVGRLAQASAFIDEHSSVFFKQGQESPGTLIRLRLESMVRMLQPVEASLFAQRALSESAELAPKERARIDFLLAQNEVVAGRWWRAARMLAAARESATDRSLNQDIDAFAKKFPPMGKGK